VSLPTDYDGYAAVVFDLDGTLVRLAVDWAEARTAAAAALADAGVEPGDRSLWALLDLAEKRDRRETVERVLIERELDGAERSTRLPAADHLPALERPVAVCSLNGEAPVRRALSVHGLADAVGATVGRDSLAARKPDPEPLLAALDGIGADPESALFVGDGERDAEAAARAGVDFRYVEGAP
jgi:phosphoglycolate phosphatase